MKLFGNNRRVNIENEIQDVLWLPFLFLLFEIFIVNKMFKDLLVSLEIWKKKHHVSIEINNHLR